MDVSASVGPISSMVMQALLRHSLGRGFLGIATVGSHHSKMQSQVDGSVVALHVFPFTGTDTDSYWGGGLARAP